MTIAAAYLTSEGVVLGADSATIVSGKTPEGSAGVLQVLTHAQKVFEVGENSRFGVCTYGSGSVGGVSHRAIVARLADRLGVDATVGSARDALSEVVQEASKSADREVGDIGYYIGGWDPGEHEPACYQLFLPAVGEADVKSLSLGGQVSRERPSFSLGSSGGSTRSCGNAFWRP